MNNYIQNYYDAIRSKNQEIRRKRKIKIYSEIPELEKIEAEMKTISANLALSIISSEDEARTLKDMGAEKLNLLKMKRDVLLTDHNYTPNYLEPIYECEKCKDRGFIKNKPCECFQKLRILQGEKRSNLFTLMRKQNFENFDYSLFSDTPLTEASALFSDNNPNLRSYIKNLVEYLKKFTLSRDKLGVYIFGDTGVGKTYLCSCICKFSIEHNKRTEYYSMNSIVDIVSSYRFGSDNPWDKKREDRAKYMSLLNTEFLIIDDLGSEIQNKLVISELFTVINQRIEKGKKTLISSNLRPNDIGSFYGERTASRILGIYDQFLIEGDDLRQS